jgi:metallophosphoesterase superfamily enzyme
MKIVHISDLHFGCERGDVVQNLKKCISKLAPDLVIISGDLTQRARGRQFQAARKFLNELGAPEKIQWLAVPGNHDLPLFNLLSRFLTPFRGYRKHINSNLNMSWFGRGTAVYGFNTTGRINWNRGRIKSKDAERARDFFDSVSNSMHKVLVVHHPTVPFEILDVDVVLCGHLHLSSARITKVHGRSRDLIVVAAGTAVSKRERAEPNSFNEIILKEDYLCLRVHSSTGKEFSAGEWAEYLYHPKLHSPEVTSSGPSSETGPRSI